MLPPVEVSCNLLDNVAFAAACIQEIQSLVHLRIRGIAFWLDQGPMSYIPDPRTIRTPSFRTVKVSPTKLFSLDTDGARNV